MSTVHVQAKSSFLAILCGLVALPAAFPGPAAIGSVAGGVDTTLNGVPIQPRTTLFSGDSLKVKSGFAVVTVGPASRLVLGRDTTASFSRDASELTILLDQGNISLVHSQDNLAMRIKAGNIMVAPASGYESLGEVALSDGYLLVSSREGTLLVDDSGQTIKVIKGKLLKIASRPSQSPPKAAATPEKSRRHLINWSGNGVKAATTGSSVTSTIVSAIAIRDANDTTSSWKTFAADELLAQQSEQAAALASSAAAGLLSNACNGIVIITNALSPSFPVPTPPACGGTATPAVTTKQSGK